jgi:hypothetical protein
VINIRKRDEMKTKTVSFITAILAVSSFVAASTLLDATTPAGWKVLVDMTKSCQISVPSDWIVSSSSLISADSPDKKADVRMNVTNLGHTLREFKVTAEQIYVPIKIFEDSKSRLWFSYEEPSAPEGIRVVNFFVGIPVEGNVCAARVSFEKRRLESVAKQIAQSLAAAK